MGAEVRIAEALEPLVQARGLVIWDVERSGTSVRVLVDRPGGVDLEALAALSGDISRALDQHDDLVPVGHYELDVSSPGVERRLRRPEHYLRSLGQEVAVKTSEAVEGERRFQGVLTGATDQDVTISAEVGNGLTVEARIPFHLIERAHTVFRWGPPPRTGKSKRTAKPADGAPGAKSPVTAGGVAVPGEAG